MYAIHYQAKSKSLKAFCLYRQMIGKAQELKSGGGFTNVRSRALSSCAFAQNMHTLLSQLKCVALDPDCCVRQEFLSRNRQLFADFYLQIRLTKQRLVWYNSPIREETNHAALSSSLPD